MLLNKTLNNLYEKMNPKESDEISISDSVTQNPKHIEKNRITENVKSKRNLIMQKKRNEKRINLLNQKRHFHDTINEELLTSKMKPIMISSINKETNEINSQEKMIESLKTNVEELIQKVNELRTIIISLTEQQILLAEKIDFDNPLKNIDDSTCPYIN